MKKMTDVREMKEEKIFDGNRQVRISFFRISLLIILFACMVFLSANLNIMRQKFFPVNVDRPIGLQLMSEMIGEVRTIIASYIYIRTDLYHHERQDRIDWKKDPATLPLHRIITALDPKFWQAYDFGAYHLSVNLKKNDEAIKFLQEGLQNNPNNYNLNFTMGDLNYNVKNFDRALAFYEKSLHLSTHRVDKANALRRIFWIYVRTGNKKKAQEILPEIKKVASDKNYIRTLQTKIDEIEPTGNDKEE